MLKWHISSANVTCLGTSIFIQLFQHRSSSFSQSSQLLVCTIMQGRQFWDREEDAADDGRYGCLQKLIQQFKNDKWWEKTIKWASEELNMKNVWAKTVSENLGSEQNMRKEIYSDISARWLKVHNIFISMISWNVKILFHQTQHN